MEEIKKFIEENKTRKNEESGMRLLTKADCIKSLDLFKKNNVKLCGFEGYRVFPSGSIQSDQTFWRDYSRFTQQQAWELCYEYFNKDTSSNVEYELFYEVA